MTRLKHVLPPIHALLPTIALLSGLFLLSNSGGWLSQPRPAETQPPIYSQALVTLLAPTHTRIAPTRKAAPTHPVQTARTATPFRPAALTRTPVQIAARPSPTPPASAEVKGMSGYGQLLPLSCEARAAADWARHFGVIIHELDFMSRLPTADNPEEGFAGSPFGDWGQIPPGPYGVHAGPVALVLQSYGVGARAARNLRYADLQAELAAGRPVIIWVVGHVEPGKGVPYHIDGKTVTVARYEHTVILTGYDQDEVTILDGKTFYQRPVDVFMKSWGALENMAILWAPAALSPIGDALP